MSSSTGRSGVRGTGRLSPRPGHAVRAIGQTAMSSALVVGDGRLAEALV
ncbi:hypothetical protein [Streptomyces sp. NBC_01187]|nr:hypothetical protein OG220_40900 [Streptomyces sp. NBC_01187]